jgi:uncharacterized membrane protein YdbT with pleckstrin-like domain
MRRPLQEIHLVSVLGGLVLKSSCDTLFNIKEIEMSYVEKSLGENEELKHRFGFHWVINFNIYGFHLIMLLLVATFWMSLDLLAVLFLIPSVIYHLSIKNTEHAVTSKRVIYKTGIIARKTEEQMLPKVETVEVSQGILGRMFGYGDIKVTGTGSSFVLFKGIDDPIDVKKKIESLL